MRAVESWVPPVTSASEPPSGRAAVWRFRLVLLLLLAAAVAVVIVVINQLQGAYDGGETDPAGLRPASSAAAPSPGAP